jgi:3D (Asp-Asp-Asp) domain-containing protein
MLNSYADDTIYIEPFDLATAPICEDGGSYTLVDDSLDPGSETDEELVDVSEEDVEEVDSDSHYIDLGSFKLTSYCSCVKCNGKWTGSLTALGTRLTTNRTIAVDSRVIPLGSWVEINIPGKGWQKFRAEDTGSAVKGNIIDVYIGTNHADCNNSDYNRYAEVRLVI